MTLSSLLLGNYIFLAVNCEVFSRSTNKFTVFKKAIMKIFTGLVIAKRSEKTAMVAVTRVMAHPVYRKRIKSVKKYQVHDELGVSVGQKVNFVASRPYSKTKKWKILEVFWNKDKKTSDISTRNSKSKKSGQSTKKNEKERGKETKK